MESINAFLGSVDDFVWGVWLIVLILAVGLFLTIRSGGIQFKKLGTAFKFAFKSESSGEGDVSSFGALCTALSATIGTGNIVGVATAICVGGPGALFWMWIAALLGTATKYAECLLATKYRTVAEDGHVLGGPFYYIEKGMGEKWKWLAKLFAALGVGAGLLGIGTITQINGITSAVETFVDPDKMHVVSLFGNSYSWAVVVSGVVVTVLAALVIIGGIKRITKVSEIVVPFMAVLYIVVALTILITNITLIPDAFVEIIQSAFGMRAATGGAIGAMLLAMQKGIARGIFSNEAGLGSAPIAAAAAKVDSPAKQGLISMTGTVIDTLIICTMTGLCIVLTGAHNAAESMGLEGAQVTNYAFQQGLPLPAKVSSFILMMCLAFFAFTTILGWDYYSERCLEYLTKGKMGPVKVYRWLYILAVLIGPFLTVSAVWTIADIFNGLMAVPNLVALVALGGVVAAETKIFIDKADKAKESK